MGWLAGITAPDLDITFEANKHFTAVQEMSEEVRQEITYQGAFGYNGPVLRRMLVDGVALPPAQKRKKNATAL